MIQLVTFDLDNTLWETESVVVAAEQTLLHWLEKNAPKFAQQLDFEARMTLRNEVLAAQPELRHRVTPLRIAVLELGLRKAGYSDKQASKLAKQGFKVFLDARHQLEYFPHVEVVLELLSRQYQLASISNGNADVRRLGLDRFFKIIVSADEVGLSKPDAAPFQTALEAAGVEPSQALHIGDHPGDDIQGALDVGMHTLWFNPQGKAWPQQPRPHGEIRCLSEIPPWLNRYVKYAR
ncbi:MAG TPA: HAD family hydrolase [Pseudomonas sabulinigri]|uniref:HAD family hydrolase n=1 Tax=marine sediment metagenome TaxID=412755 RepID=A0A0F9SVM3_9ZZZZ|nr:HAD family hydrolase [Halopseudomonas sabulinigri]HEC52489.1 HAD family hydrolase [Halopseudomonas sabulinigri]